MKNNLMNLIERLIENFKKKNLLKIKTFKEKNLLKMKLKITIDMLMQHHSLDKTDPHPGLCSLFATTLDNLSKRQLLKLYKSEMYVIKDLHHSFYSREFIKKHDISYQQVFWWDTKDHTIREIVLRAIIKNIQEEIKKLK